MAPWIGDFAANPCDYVDFGVHDTPRGNPTRSAHDDRARPYPASPVGPKELALIAASGYREFPPRLPEQPIFYPVTNEDYARQIAEHWNVNESGSGYVTRFAVREDFMARYPAQQVGARLHTEHWIPAEELPELNRNIVTQIEVTLAFEPA